MKSRWRTWLAILAALGIVAGSAYLWWWKPLILASMRFGLERALASVRPRATFQTLDLAGLSTVVLRSVVIGTRDDPYSAVIQELRLTFDLTALVWGNFDVASSLRHVKLVGPHVTATWPVNPSQSEGRPLHLGLPPHVTIEATAGQLLLRSAVPAAGSITLTDVDLEILPGGGRGHDYAVTLTAPQSPRRGVRARGNYSAKLLTVGLNLKRLDVMPLRPWLKSMGWSAPPEKGMVSTALKMTFARPAGTWTLVKTDGELDLTSLTLTIPGLPFPLANMTGAAQFQGSRLRLVDVTVQSPQQALVVVNGTLIFLNRGEHITLEGVTIRTAGGQLEADGEVFPEQQLSELTWKFTSRRKLFAATGSLAWANQALTVSARSSDPAWSFTGEAKPGSRAWQLKIRAQASDGARASLTGTVGNQPPHQLYAALSLANASRSSLHMDADAHFKTLEMALTASGELTGTLRDPMINADVSLRSLRWHGLNLGKLTCALKSRSRQITLARVKLLGPVCTAEGDGELTLVDDGWQGTGSFTVARLKAGSTELDARARLAVTSHRGANTFDLALSALRLNAAPYPDFTGSVSWGSSPNRLNVTCSWENLLSAVLRMEGAETISLTAACSELPLVPVMGALSMPAPDKHISGSVTLKGRKRRASLTAALRWPRGDLKAKGWIDAERLDRYALTLSGADSSLSPWVPLLRTVGKLASLPDLGGEFSTRGFSLKKSGETVNADGWILLRKFAVRGQRLGSGSVRITMTKNQVEFEGSIKGTGTYTLYPTRYWTQGDQQHLQGAFAWSHVPIGQAMWGCSRGSIESRMTATQGTATLALTGLAVSGRPPNDITLHLTKRGDQWTFSSPPGSSWQAQGTLSVAGTRITVEHDDRTGGTWVLLRGPDDAQLKLDGVWPLPNVPERLHVEGTRLPAAPIFIMLGLPPIDGWAQPNLKWQQDQDPPLTGRISVTDGQWGDFPFDVFEVEGAGTPGRSFTFNQFKVSRADELQAEGTGSLTLSPNRALNLDLTAHRVLLRYLRPFGFVEDSDVVAQGRLVVSGDPSNPAVNGTLVCSPGSVTPPTGFATLQLTKGQVDFKGHRAMITATLNDSAGAAVLIDGEATYRGLVPQTYSVALTAPEPVQVDGLPHLFTGLARGHMLLDGSPAQPALHGEIVLEEGRLRNPPRQKNPDPDAFAERLDWDLAVKFGNGVKYAAKPLGVAALNVALLSSESTIHIKGKGKDFQVYGEMYVESGLLKFFMGKRIWKKRKKN